MSSFYVPHDRVITPLSDEMITKQEFKAECDINNIIKQFQMTGIVNHINNAQPIFDDLPDSIDYQESIAIARRAEEAFDALPSKVRDYFGNDPQRFLAAFNDESQIGKLRELGLVQPLPDEAMRIPQAPSFGATPGEAAPAPKPPAKAGE